jgi:hypothetical protein
MNRHARVTAVLLAVGALAGAVSVPAALADQPGPGVSPQCAGGQFPGGNGNPHCPQNK